MKVHFYCSRLNGNKICWPVEVLGTNPKDGWHHVRGLAGQFKGRTFTVIGSEVSSYVPSGYKLAPGAKAFLPKLSSEYAQAKKLHSQTYKLLSGAQSSGSIPVATAQRLLKKVEALAFTLQPRTPFDRAWKDYGKDVEEAQAQIERRNGTYAVGQLHSALGMIEGAASREKQTSGDPSRARVEYVVTSSRSKSIIGRYPTLAAAKRAVVEHWGSSTPLDRWRHSINRWPDGREVEEYVNNEYDIVVHKPTSGDPSRRNSGRDPFFGKKLGGRAKSRLSEGRAKQRFDRLYSGFKREGSSATTAYRKAIQMMPGYHTPAAQKAWLEDLAEYEKHAHLIDKDDHFHLSLRDPLRGGRSGQARSTKRDPMIRRVGKKYVLYSIKTGKRLGTHPSRAAALRQEQAIHVAKRRDPSRKSFVIETRNESMNWTPMTWYMVRARYAIPGLNGPMKFKTNAEAEEGIRLLRSFGDDWAAAEYRVV